MSRLLFFLSVLLFVTSCSSVKPINSQERRGHLSKNQPDRVDLGLNDGLGNGKNIDVMAQEETVRVGDRGGDIYDGNSDPSTDAPTYHKKLRIALNLGPGIYRTVNYVSVLKLLERKNLSPDILTGTGMGAVIAAMYASGMTPEVIEWNFYKYFKDKRNNKPFEKDWINEIDEAFMGKFKKLNIQDTKRKFYITLYDRITNKTYYFEKGNIRELLLLNLRLMNNSAEPSRGVKYTAAFEKEVFNARLLRQLGAEFAIAVDCLGTKIDFENTNEYLIGVFSKTAGRMQSEKKDFDYWLNLPVTQMSLDSHKDSQLYMQKSYEYMLKQTPILIKKIQEKMMSINNLGNDE